MPPTTRATGRRRPWLPTPASSLVHIWVRGNGTGLAVVDSHADVAGERLDLGGGIQYVLAYRRGENPARFVTTCRRMT